MVDDVPPEPAQDNTRRLFPRFLGRATIPALALGLLCSILILAGITWIRWHRPWADPVAAGHTVTKAVLVPSGPDSGPEVLLLTGMSTSRGSEAKRDVATEQTRPTGADSLKTDGQPEAGSRTQGIALISLAKKRMLWENQIYDAMAQIDFMTASPSYVFVADGFRLQALSRSTGQIVWKISLTSPIDFACQGCLRAMGSHVVVLTADGLLQGRDAQTGKPAWSRRLASFPLRLYEIDNQLLFVDSYEGNAFVTIMDPATGRDNRRLMPACTIDPEDPRVPLDPDAEAHMDAANGALYLLYEMGSRCIQRWDAKTGRLTWQVLSEDSVAHPLAAEQSLLIEVGGTLRSLDGKTGRGKELLKEGDYDFLPLITRSGLLIARGFDYRGHYELRGIQMDSAKTLWHYSLKPEEEALDATDTKIRRIEAGHHAFSAHLTSRGLVILSVSNSPEISLLTLDPTSGETKGNHRTNIAKVSPDKRFDLSLTGWANDTAVMILHKHLVLVNSETGKVSTWSGGEEMYEIP